MPIERSVIVENITQKGFIPAGGDHEYFWLYKNGLKTKWCVKISRGSGYKEYSDALIKRQARILGIRFKDVYDFFNCNSNKDEFIIQLESGAKNNNRV